MTVAAAAAKAGPYTGNDVTSSFAFSFKVFADADIRVVETVIATEVETDLVLNTNYTVSRNADQDASPGGTITYKVGGVTTALPSTKKLTIVGDFDYEQPTDIPDGGPFAASTVERALDRVTMLVKQLKEAMDRAVKVAVSSSTDPADLIADLTTSSAAAVAAASAAAISETNAGVSETNAAASAAAAAATLASALWRDVVFVTSASSPVTIAQADNGKLYVADTTGGAIIFNLPQISGIALPFTAGIKLEAGTNSVTVNRAGTDTIGGATSKILTSAGSGAQFVADIDSAPDVWTAVDFGLGDFAGSVHAATSKATPVDADELPIVDSAASNVLKKLTWANLKATLKTYFDTLYTAPVPSVRQCVLEGPVTSAGLPNYGASTGSSTVTVSGTLKATAAYGELDRTGSITNPSWTGLESAGARYFLYLTVNADGTCTTGSSLNLQPTVQWGGTYGTSNGQHTFNIQEMTGKVGNGATADQAYRVYVGEVTVSGANVVDAIYWYQLKRRYQATSTSVPSTTRITMQHYLGFIPDEWSVKLVCTSTELGYGIGEEVEANAILDAGTNPTTASSAADRFDMGIIANSNTLYLYHKTTGALTVLDTAKWDTKFYAKCSW